MTRCVLSHYSLVAEARCRAVMRCDSCVAISMQYVSCDVATAVTVQDAVLHERAVSESQCASVIRVVLRNVASQPQSSV